jgi:hypothetical protein
LQHSKSSVATSKKIIATQRDLTQEIARTLATTASLRSREGRGGGRGGRGLRSREEGGWLRFRSRGGGGCLRSSEERHLCNTQNFQVFKIAKI